MIIYNTLQHSTTYHKYKFYGRVAEDKNEVATF